MRSACASGLRSGANCIERQAHSTATRGDAVGLLLQASPCRAVCVPTLQPARATCQVAMRCRRPAAPPAAWMLLLLLVSRPHRLLVLL